VPHQNYVNPIFLKDKIVIYLRARYLRGDVMAETGTKQFSTGFVMAAGYAYKIRRTLLAQARSLGIDSKEAMRVSALINQHLFNVFREKNIDKADVVRIRFGYTVKDGKIDVDWASLVIEHYKKYAVIDKVPPPGHELEEEVTEHTHEISWDEKILKKLKAESEEVERETDRIVIKGKNWMAEAEEGERITIRFTGTLAEFEEWKKNILGMGDR